MLFNSFEFMIFFPLVVIGYFLLPPRFRWAFLLGASYYFYMCWKAEYLVLIVISTLIDYVAGLRMGKTAVRSRRKKYLLLSLVANLGILFTFKYANFFSESLRVALNQFNIFYDMPMFDLLLPVGISFYTFQSMSYTIDVYRGEQQPERHLGKFALYVAFFPQLVAGPIERSLRLLPQFDRVFKFDYERVVSGLRLMLWGFFKKLVIADRLAIYVNEAYNHPAEYQGLTLLLATYFFAIQIYCDFSGYSDIAIGAARVMGYDLMTNFRQPYFSKSISEFWRRWHISLSTWFRDYLYIPLGGNRVGKQRWYFNLFAVFVISGLWHGANWTFVVWGALHGGYLIFAIVTADWRQKLAHWSGLAKRPALHNLLRTLITFHLVLFAWIFFRANSLSEAFMIIGNMAALDFSLESLKSLNIALGWGELLVAIGSILFLELAHLLQSRGKVHSWITARPAALRWSVYYLLLLAIAFFGVFNHSEFIYFQF
ncbi:MAG: MBOAT family protein [Calditrichaeota bacterium]|nr:MBOAT family protein [Calditrichota bacterium]